ncbi:MAG TPA: cupredoxin domain-containing protein [Alphaproteobacteria bacterium]|nr:cupredoxin domain-containing protein [Alphaproteobacteria bacterium]
MHAQCVSTGNQGRLQRLSQHVIGSTVVLLAVCLAISVSGVAWTVSAGDKPVAVVEVRLVEHQIEMLTTVPPGTTTFQVTNAGTMEHNFEVESRDLEEKFDLNLKPGETKSLQVDLTPGKYTVYCPVENHKELGMRLDLTVAQQQTN